MTTPHDKSLKPCPFCGSVEGVYPSYRWPGTGAPYAIDCVGCGMDFTPREGMDAIEAWNRRASLHIPIEAGNGVDGKDGWLDIASAPKRGQILLALPNGVVREGYWGAASYNRRTKDYDYAWVTHPSSGDVKPTHWRPLPPPPSSSNEGREKA